MDSLQAVNASAIVQGGQVLRNESRSLFKALFAGSAPVPGIGDYEPCYRLRVEGVPPPYDI